MVARKPHGQQVRNQVIDVQLGLDGLPLGHVRRVAAGGAGGAQHGVVAGGGPWAAEAVVDDAAGVVLDGVVLFLGSAECFGGP